MAKIKFEGLDKLEKRLKDNVTLNDVKKVVKHHGGQLQKRMQENADFTKGYQTGTTKRSIGLEITDGGLTAEVEPKTEYAPYLEYGTRFMEAQPFVQPSLDEQSREFLNDIRKIMR